MAFSSAVNSLNGSICTIFVVERWAMREVKTAIFEQAGVRSGDQKLLLGTDVEGRPAQDASNAAVAGITFALDPVSRSRWK